MLEPIYSRHSRRSPHSHITVCIKLLMWYQACQAILRKLFLIWIGGTKKSTHACMHSCTYTCKYLGVRVTLPIGESRNTSSPPLLSPRLFTFYFYLLAVLAQAAVIYCRVLQRLCAGQRLTMGHQIVFLL